MVERKKNSGRQGITWGLEDETDVELKRQGGDDEREMVGWMDP